MNRVVMILLLPALALDCLGNVLCAVLRSLWFCTAEGLWTSWGFTLSGTAWTVRSHRVFWWTHRFIDTLFWFQPDHCKVQAEREALHGSVWAAWASDWKQTPGTVP